MGTALYVGPIALPWSLLMAVAAAALGMVVGVSWGRRQGVEVAALAWRVLLVTITICHKGIKIPICIIISQECSVVGYVCV